MASRQRKTKVALYLRVSTTDKGQKTDNQLLQLQERCEEQSWEIYDTYIDHESGRKGRRLSGAENFFAFGWIQFFLLS